MTRKDFVSILAVLFGVIIAGSLALIAWAILLIPVLVNPHILPDPRSAVTTIITRRAMKSMMKGGLVPNDKKAA